MKKLLVVAAVCAALNGGAVYAGQTPHAAAHLDGYYYGAAHRGTQAPATFPRARRQPKKTDSLFTTPARDADVVRAGALAPLDAVMHHGRLPTDLAVALQGQPSLAREYRGLEEPAIPGRVLGAARAATDAAAMAAHLNLPPGIDSRP